MILCSFGPAIGGQMMNNPWVQQDGDPNRWCIGWNIQLLPGIQIGYNEDSKDYYRHIVIEWLGLRLGIHYSQPTGLQKQEDI